MKPVENMKKRSSFNYLYLVNSLVLFAADFKYLKGLDGPDFDVEFDIGSDFEIGFNQDLLDGLLTEGAVTKDVFDGLLDFKAYVLLIPDSFWTFEELEANSIWDTVRAMAGALLSLMGESAIEYNFSVIRKI